VHKLKGKIGSAS